MISSLPSSGAILFLLLGAFGCGVLFARHALPSRRASRRSTGANGPGKRPGRHRSRRERLYASLVALVWISGGTLYYALTIDDGCPAPARPAVATAGSAAGPTAAGVAAAPSAAAAAVATAGAAAPARPPVTPSAAPSVTVPTPPAAAKTAAARFPVLTVYFGRQSAQMEITPDARAALPALRAAAQQGHKIAVAGYSDNRGQSDRKAALSLQRAHLLRDWLLTEGFTAQQIVSTESRGDQEPVADNATPEGRAQNRRAEARVVP